MFEVGDIVKYRGEIPIKDYGTRYQFVSIEDGYVLYRMINTEFDACMSKRLQEDFIRVFCICPEYMQKKKFKEELEGLLNA